jgi:hypothetical protein
MLRSGFFETMITPQAMRISSLELDQNLGDFTEIR